MAGIAKTRAAIQAYGDRTRILNGILSCRTFNFQTAAQTTPQGLLLGFTTNDKNQLNTFTNPSGEVILQTVVNMENLTHLHVIHCLSLHRLLCMSRTRAQQGAVSAAMEVTSTTTGLLWFL